MCRSSDRRPDVLLRPPPRRNAASGPADHQHVGREDVDPAGAAGGRRRRRAAAPSRFDRRRGFRWRAACSRRAPAGCHRPTAERRACRSGELEPARAGVRDVVGAIAARPAERAGGDNQVVVVVEEHRRFDESAAVEKRLVDAGVEALAALGLERRVVGEGDLERVRRTDAGTGRAADLREVAVARRRRTTPRKPSGSPTRPCRWGTAAAARMRRRRRRATRA